MLLRSFLSLALIAAPALATVGFEQLVDGVWLAGTQTLTVATDLEGVDRVEVRVDGILVGVLRSAPWQVSFDFGDGSRPRRLQADVWAGGYATHQRAEITVGAVPHEEAMTVDWVEVPVALSRPPRSAESFRVFENGRPMEVRELKSARGPTRFVFIVDRSQSMDAGRLESASRAIRAIASRLDQGDTADVIGFNHRVGPAASIEEFDLSSASGGTAVRDALASIDAESRTVAIVISDGNDRNSFLSEEEALRTIATDRIAVHAVLLGRGNANGFLRRVAEATGGSMRTSSAAALAGDLQKLLDEIESRWVLSYQSSATGAGWRPIRIESAERGLRVLEARKGYFAR